MGYLVSISSDIQTQMTGKQSLNTYGLQLKSVYYTNTGGTLGISTDDINGFIGYQINATTNLCLPNPPTFGISDGNWCNIWVWSYNTTARTVNIRRDDMSGAILIVGSAASNATIRGTGYQFVVMGSAWVMTN
jgi:hypothetical protein